MPLVLPDDYWIEIPGGRYVVGLLPEEAKHLAAQSAAWFDQHGPEWSINDAKLERRAFELLERQGNPTWVEAYLLEHFPAREVEIAPFAIARRPIVMREYRQFMEETGETDRPSNERFLAKEPDFDERPVNGINWAPAVALAEWAGARIPFEHEWERAIRGPHRYLFPWGNDLGAHGKELLDDQTARLWRVDATSTPEGVQGALIGMFEWCADYWSEPDGIDRKRWREIPARSWSRVVRGGNVQNAVIASGVVRRAFATIYDIGDSGIRLVRADGRTIPGPHPSTPRGVLMWAQARTFEVHTLWPLLKALGASRVGREHELKIGYKRDFYAAISSVMRIATEGLGFVRDEPKEDPSAFVYGLFLVAESRETVRRHPPEHGVFAWNIQYRYAEDGHLRARPVVAYRMAFDGRIHKFVHRFKPDEADTRIDELTPALIQDHVLSSFHFYEAHADDDRSPFGAG